MFLRSLESARLGIFVSESSTMHRHCAVSIVPFDPLLVDKNPVCSSSDCVENKIQ